MNLVIGQEVKCYGLTMARMKLADNRLLSNPVKHLPIVADSERFITGYFCGYATVADYSDGSDSVGAYLNAIVKFETSNSVMHQLIDIKYVEVVNND